MFNNINAPGIVLFEDFDCYFDKRKSLLEKADFTFDSIINGMDGLYCDTKGLIYFLTTNNLENVDVSLKERPSRFKYVIEVKNPSDEIRGTIFDNQEDIDRTQGMSLDELKEQMKMQKIVEKLAAGNVVTTDEEVQEYIEKNKDFLPEGATPEELVITVKGQLEQQKKNEQVQSWIQALQEKAKITYFNK